MAWGGVLGAFAQIPGAWDGLVRALTPPQLQQHAQQKVCCPSAGVAVASPAAAAAPGPRARRALYVHQA